MNIIKTFKSLPIKTRQLLGIGVIFALVVALPLFIWGITELKFDVRKYATGEGVETATASATSIATATSTSVSTATATATSLSTATATSTAASIIPGDVNADGVVNIVDIGIVVDHYGENSSSYLGADLNGDGIINIVDLGVVISNY